jgi:hypothetical protein
MKFRQAKHQAQRARYSQHQSGESPPPRSWSSGERFANRSARGFDGGPRKNRIVHFEDVVGPGRNDHLRIRYCSHLDWPIDFLK